jgi:transposase InsO family protein
MENPWTSFLIPIRKCCCVHSYDKGNLACKALQQALLKEQPDSGLIHHTDRGCQYTSKAYRLLLEKNDIIVSMSRKGVPYDNATMESFFQTLKTEYVTKDIFRPLSRPLPVSDSGLIFTITVGGFIQHWAINRRYPMKFQEYTHSMCPLNPIRRVRIGLCNR